MTEEQLKAKSNAILDKLEESGFDLDDWSIEDAHNNGFIDGYRECQKEHKWHYVKDGLPNKGVLCAVLLVNNDLIFARLREDNVWTTNGHNAFENVIAWKEIVLPELKENE